MGNNLIYMRRRLGIMAQPHRESKTGNLVTFTGIKAPLSILAQIVPVQSGSGDPSPDNVRPISGWTGCEVFDESEYSPSATPKLSVTFPNGMTVYGGSLQINTDGTGVLTNTQYDFDLGGYDWTFDSRYNRAIMDGSIQGLYHVTNYARDVEFLCNKYKCIHNRESIGNVPNNSIYSQYQGSFGGTKFWVHDTAMIGMTSEQIKSYLTGTIIVYPLLTPVTYNLTAEQVGKLLALNGANNIWANTGEISVEYWKH